MNIFTIKAPEVSAGLKRTYNKQLEVYECESEVFERTQGYNPGTFIKVTKVLHMYVYHEKQGWVKKSPRLSNHDSFRKERISETASVNHVAFTNFKAAAASKLMMIQQMAVVYEKTIDELKDTFRKNVPDIQKPFEELLAEHPELFI